MNYVPPEGYEIRSMTGYGLDDADGKFVKITPYYRGRPISEGQYPSTYGYGSALRKARKAIRLHRKYNVDKEN